MGTPDTADGATGIAAIGIAIAAAVYDRDGRKVGHVAAHDAAGIVVGRGLVVLLRSRVSASDVDRCERGRVVLRVTRSDVTGA